MSFVLPPAPRFRPPRRARTTSQAPVDEQSGLEAALATNAPRMPWDRFIRQFHWLKGEHAALIGPTGQGKTNLLWHILNEKPYVAVLATKPKDESMNRLIRAGYVRMPAWRSTDPVDTPRRVIWPDATDIDSVARQKEIFRDMFRKVYREGNWTIAVDEMWYIINELKLQQEIRVILTQGRSIGLSLVAGVQRPRHIPLEIYDQSTHLFFWRDPDKGNIDRVSEINTENGELLKYMIPRLERFQVLYANTRTGQMVRTHAPAPTE